MAYRNRDCFFIGTEERSGWFRSPLRNADSSPQAWSEGGVLLNGGGYQFNSWGSHKVYQYEWGSATPMLMAQKLKSYYDGSNGRGLMYFYEPSIYDKNVLPARWADPSIALDNEGSGLVYGVTPTVATDDFDPDINNYPLFGASYDLTNVAEGWRGREDSLYLPIPDGYTLAIGAAGSSTGTAGVMYRTSNRGVLGTTGTIPMLPDDGFVSLGYGLDPYGLEPFEMETTPQVINTYVRSSSTVRGIWLFLGKTSSGAGTVDIHGMTARLIKTSLSGGVGGLGYGFDPYGRWVYGGTANYSPTMAALAAGPWTGGMGHSGTRFMAPPTFSTTGPLNGGQVGFAASFREVGSYAYA